MSFVRVSALLLPALLLTGCSMTPTATPVAEAGPTLRGNVHGGQQPVVGARVYLYAANTAGYGGDGIAASSSNASISLLTSAANTTQDENNNYYVTTDTSGNFSITGDYTCSPSAAQQIYVYAVGGNPGAGTNTAAAFLAILGNCPAGGTSSVPFVWMNEVTTVAAAYAFAGFATDATHVSSSNTSLATTGIANAFANASNLVDISTGTALATTPAGNGTVPQQEINTLANILAACVNTNGSGACDTLLPTATSDGTLSGTQPTDTATAAINIAHHPGANVTTLYDLPSATPAFAPALTSQPNDFAVGINFAGSGISYPGGIAIDAAGNAWVANTGTSSISKLSSTGAVVLNSDTNGGISTPIGVAIDSAGNAWIANNGNNSVTELSSTGNAVLSSITNGGFSTPYGIAIDAAGNAWITNNGSDSITELSSTGSALLSSVTGNGISHPYGIAIDGAGSAWIANVGNNSVTKLSSSGSALLSGVTNGGLNKPSDIAIDSAGNAWIVNNGNSSLTELSNTDTALISGMTGGGISTPSTIAVDGAGNAWIANTSSITEVSSAGTVLSPNGYTGGGGISNPLNIAVDGSGDVWVPSAGTNRVTEFIGASAPVITPICAGLPATPSGDGTSNLGTRP